MTSHLKFNKRATCSFCGSYKEYTVRAKGTNKVICSECVSRAKMQWNEIPKGAIRCFKCEAFESFTVRYKNSVVKFEYSGLDEVGNIVYMPAEIEGVWRKNVHATAKSCTCNLCNSDIPVALLDLSPYV